MIIIIINVWSVLVYQFSTISLLENFFILVKDFSHQKAHVMFSTYITWVIFLFLETVLRDSLMKNIK